MNEWSIVMFNKFVNVAKEKFLRGEMLNDVLTFIVAVKKRIRQFWFQIKKKMLNKSTAFLFILRDFNKCNASKCPYWSL